MVVENLEERFQEVEGLIDRRAAAMLHRRYGLWGACQIELAAEALPTTPALLNPGPFPGEQGTIPGTGELTCETAPRGL